jgi:hypothetical protein
LGLSLEQPSWAPYLRSQRRPSTSQPRAEAVANGMRVTFVVAAVLMMAAIAVAVVSRVRAR